MMEEDQAFFELEKGLKINSYAFFNTRNSFEQILLYVLFVLSKGEELLVHFEHIFSIRTALWVLDQAALDELDEAGVIIILVFDLGHRVSKRDFPHNLKNYNKSTSKVPME
jgi:hypothetical protein